MRDQFEGRLEPCLEGAQVAIVDADQRRLELEGGLQFVRVVYLDQHRHAEIPRERFQMGHFFF